MSRGLERIPFGCHSYESGNPGFFSGFLRAQEGHIGHAAKPVRRPGARERTGQTPVLPLEGAAAAGLALGVASGQAGLPAVGKGESLGLVANPAERFVHFQRSGRSVPAEADGSTLLWIFANCRDTKLPGFPVCVAWFCEDGPSLAE
jgi:hypothetical protein